MSLILSLALSLIITFFSNTAPEFSKGVLLLCASITFFLAGKVYAHEWQVVKKESILKFIFERLWLPVLTAYIFLGDNVFFTGATFEKVLLILLVISLSDIDNSIRRFVGDKFTDANDINRRICYLNYPPKDRLDIFPMEILFHILSIVIIFKKLIW